MLKSMTGFGAGRASVGAGEAMEEISIELRSVNHKFCEVKARLPRELTALELALVKRVKERIARGALDVTLRRQTAGSAGQVPVVDEALVREYQRAFGQVAQAAGRSESAPLTWLAQQPGVIRMDERGVAIDHATAAATQALETALEALIAMRQAEGRALAEDLTARLQLVTEAAREVEALAPRAVADYRTRLQERIVELSASEVDPQRLAQEVAFFAERTDIAEEMTRLSSHLEQFRALIAADEPVGRKMDFLVQEMHREVNTTGSKSQHPEISLRVVAMKAELERLREQVQNVE